MHSQWEVEDFFSRRHVTYAGSRKPKTVKISLGILLCGCRFKFEVGKCFLKSHFLWQTAPGWTISFIWLMKSEKAPLKVTRSACSVEKTLLCHYAHLWCTVYTIVSSLWKQLLSSSSLKGHYGMGKPSWPQANYIICLVAPRERA